MPVIDPESIKPSLFSCICTVAPFMGLGIDVACMIPSAKNNGAKALLIWIDCEDIPTVAGRVWTLEQNNETKPMLIWIDYIDCSDQFLCRPSCLKATKQTQGCHNGSRLERDTGYHKRMESTSQLRFEEAEQPGGKAAERTNPTILRRNLISDRGLHLVAGAAELATADRRVKPTGARLHPPCDGLSGPSQDVMNGLSVPDLEGRRASQKRE